jgi:hypothetical protein
MNIREARAKLIAQEQELHMLQLEAGAMRRALTVCHETELVLRKHIEQLQHALNEIQPAVSKVRTELARVGGLDALAHYDAARGFASEVYDDVE